MPSGAGLPALGQPRLQGPVVGDGEQFVEEQERDLLGDEFQRVEAGRLDLDGDVGIGDAPGLAAAAAVGRGRRGGGWRGGRLGGRGSCRCGRCGRGRGRWRGGWLGGGRRGGWGGAAVGAAGAVGAQAASSDAAAEPSTA